MSYNRNLMIKFVTKFNRINVSKGSIYKLNSVQVSVENTHSPLDLNIHD